MRYIRDIITHLPALHMFSCRSKVSRCALNRIMLCSLCCKRARAVASLSWSHRLSLARYKSDKLESISNDVFTPPTFGRLEIDEQAPLVNAYTTNGFVIRNNFVYGSVALLPRTLLNWKVRLHILQLTVSPGLAQPDPSINYSSTQVTSIDEITPESFALFYLVQPKIGKLLLPRSTVLCL